LPDKLIKRALPAHQAKPDDSGHDRRPGQENYYQRGIISFHGAVPPQGIGIAHGADLEDPSTDALVQKNVLGVERFKLWVFRCSKLLANEVVSAQVQAKPTTPTALIHKPVTGTNSMKKCSQRLLEKAIPKSVTRSGWQ